MNKRLLVATLAVAALAPLAAHAGGGVTVSVSTPEFGFRIGAPFYGAPVYGPVPIYAPAPVFVPPPVFVPQQVIVVPARVIHRAPVVVIPRRGAYAPVFVPPPRYRDRHWQQVSHRVPPGHVKHYNGKGRYQ
jgi:hypothetical protein